MTRAMIALVLVAFGCRSDVKESLRNWLEEWELTWRCLMPDDRGIDPAEIVAVNRLARRHDSDSCIIWRSLPDVDVDSIPGWREVSDELYELRISSRDVEAIQRIDRQMAALREHAGMPAAVRPARRDLVALPSGHHMITKIGSDAFYRDRLVVQAGRIEGEFASPPTGFSITSPDHVHRWVSPQGTKLALPSRSWSAIADATQLVIRNVGNGVEQVLPLSGHHETLAAMDRGTIRAVFLKLHGAAQQVRIAISEDAGQRWRIETLPESGVAKYASQDPVSGDVDVFVGSLSEESRLHFGELPPTTPSAGPRRPVTTSSSWSVRCRDGDVLWLATPSGDLLLSTLAGTRTVVTGAHDIADCRGTRALVLELGGLLSCGELGCRRLHANDHNLLLQAKRGAAFLDDGTWVYAAEDHGVVAVWSQHAKSPGMFRLAEGQELNDLVMMKGVLYLVVIDAAQTLRLVPLPELPKKPRNSSAT